MIYMIESQLNYAMDALRVMRERRVDFVEVRQEAQDRNTTRPGWTFIFTLRTRGFDADKYVLATRSVRPSSQAA
jgi:hypothetical protein